MSQISTPSATAARSTRVSRKLTVLPLVAATYFMVAGGPYGLEDLIGKTGYALALVILVVTPLLWSLPTALMVSELSTALPEEGGFYVWVRRGMGPFWGFQESWLTLTGSVFEMALYPTLFVDYLGRFAPRWTDGFRGTALALPVIVVCATWNILGARAVGETTIWLNALLFAPFVAIIVIAAIHPAVGGATTAPPLQADVLGGILIAMWNYMGWDNTSTIANDVDRPQRTYPLAMLGAMLLVIGSYILPVAAVAHARLDIGMWTAGDWVDAGRVLGGGALATAVAVAGMIGAIGTFGTLMLSFARLPAVMADDGFLPGVFDRHMKTTGAPWVAIALCAVIWALCLPLGFVRLLLLDVLLTGLSILLEFWALVALRIREPGLARPYRVPGGVAGAVAIGIPPLALMVLAFVRDHSERVGNFSELTIGLGILALGVVLYLISPGSRRQA